MNISLLLAFSAGVISFLSPCILPLVPAYISYITGSNINETNNKKSYFYVLYKSIGFVIGFSIIFVLMGVSVTSLGKIFIKNKILFRKISGILIFIFGLHITGIFKINLFYREKKFFSFSKSNGTFTSILMGMAFATGWTPCVGPILSSILAYAGNMETIVDGIILLIFYSLGLGIPFIFSALTIDSLISKIKIFNKYIKTISVLSGIFLIIFGSLIFTNKLGILNQYLNFL
ncbi:cytochrome c-type biogenesis protein [Clostridium sp. USBA 49]|jgi:cytochrome c-type biogenesis protein|uniref:cytochrome c biogenesis CcdA family protein n=1 Tax=Clostridium TaxID=1485 RepID=UPI000998F1DE|nr:MULTISPECIES: cytochrome c biogenesis protein CcdA [Clostridium]SKA72783.1 cytochrome c-type biogenesis protein [Clostridium sp. USBA 49]